MSRYSKRFMSGDTIMEVAWGYDMPLTEYFVQLQNISEPLEDGEDNYVFSISNVFTMLSPREGKFAGRLRYSNGDILELIEEYNLGEHIPKEHLEAIAADLTF